jgi:hypothetical protein
MQVEMLKQTALVDIQVSPSFLQRLQEMLTWMINTQDPEKVRAANEKLAKNQEDLDEWEEHYVTLLILVNTIESNAKSQGKTELVDVPQNSIG